MICVMFLCSLCVLVIILNFMCCIGLCSNCFSYWVAHRRSICSLGTTGRSTVTIHYVFCFFIYTTLFTHSTGSKKKNKTTITIIVNVASPN